jgi:hypothetical protein
MSILKGIIAVARFSCLRCSYPDLESLEQREIAFVEARGSELEARGAWQVISFGFSQRPDQAPPASRDLFELELSNVRQYLAGNGGNMLTLAARCVASQQSLRVG